jgi:hypothetical protein
MHSQVRRESAVILQFPPPGARDRIGLRAQANTKQKSVVFEASASSFGGAWYHEAAILEADRPRKP